MKTNQKMTRFFNLSAFSLIITLFFASLSPVPMAQGLAAHTAYAVQYDAEIASIIAQVDQNVLYDYTAKLSGEQPVVVGGENYTILTRKTNSGVPIQKATTYVYEYLQSLPGLDSVAYQSWQTDGFSNRNVVGVLNGTTRADEIVLLTAHLDNMPGGGRAPGADDNASGSAALMAAADILSKYQFQRTVRFVFFTGEEQGTLGSWVYARKARSAGEKIVAALNMDMLAWDKKGEPTMRLHTRAPQTGAGDLEIANLFVDVVNTYAIALSPIITSYGMDESDHASFWEYNYSAICIIEDDGDLNSWGDFNPNYHTVNDTLANLNMPYFTHVTAATVGSIAHLAALDDGSTPAVAHVKKIVMSPQILGWSYRTKAIATIVDADNLPLSGATVVGVFSGATSSRASKPSGATGQAIFYSAYKPGGGTWKFCVRNVIKSGWVYDPNANARTCLTIKIP
jgi:hypothetical protein